MSARVKLLRPIPKMGIYNAPVELDLSREQWLAASALLGADAVLLDYRSPPEVEAVIDALMTDGPAQAVEQPAPVKAPKKKR
jgi:hypothetical protein